MWLHFLQQWNGVSIFHDSDKSHAPEMHLYTDASSSGGHGGYFEGRWFCEEWSSEHHIDCIIDRDASAQSMAMLELYPIVVAAMLWGHLWIGKCVVFHCDNLSVVHIIQKGRAKCLKLMKLMRRLMWCALHHNFSFHAIHVPGIHNNIADSLSRLQMHRFRLLAPRAEPLPHKCPRPCEVTWS